ncbi:PREDICTED: actin, alpha skeletal muscle 2-like [Elephantulus edwardii]|uniref:actin, alpha skeletal muscle 2-like n=1 Tax=Elephantulus edwardii TaxID=28737 RepID=UPI0003F0ECC8|nr:PREDICTED: actin, alpha skeletal muscle 2-like [Elephantulus edwardii]
MDNNPIVCDYGSGVSKVGFGGMESPMVVFPTVLGKLRHDKVLVGMDEKTWFLGTEAQNNRKQLNLQSPLCRAVITDWDRTTIESGEGMTYFVPVFDGCPVHQSTLQLDIAGQDLTLYFLQLLTESDQVCVQDIKERCCYVALDFEKELAKASLPSFKQTFQLLDGQEIELGKERFMCPEALFNPSLIGKNTLGIHMVASQSVASCKLDFWKTLYSNILLSGGTGSCFGLRFRLQKEISDVVSPLLKVKVSSCPYSIYSSWVGGSILCSLPTFKDMWITRDEYMGTGSSIISRRSF